MIRVLVVDDSASARRALTEGLSRCEDIEVIGTAVDPFVAREKIMSLCPDVVTLDIKIQGSDGLTFLADVVKHSRARVVVVSSGIPEGSETFAKAVQMGAADVLPKPVFGLANADALSGLVRAVRAAGASNPTPHSS